MNGSELLTHDTVAWINGVRTRWHIPGLTVCAVSKDREGRSRDKQVVCLGQRNHRGDNIEASSIFSIASCSKLFTAFALGLLIADATILPNGSPMNWETKIKDILPDWRLSDPYASDHADLIDLLSMRIGLPGHDRVLHGQTPSEVIRLLPDLPLSFEFRQGRQYSNMSYIIASELVTRLSKMPFPDFVHSRIFGKLDMSRTTYGIDKADKRLMVQGFVQRGVNTSNAGKAWAGRLGDAVPKDCTGTPVAYEWDLDDNHLNNAGAGGLWTTAEDMLYWMCELISPTLLPAEVWRTIATPHSIPLTRPPHPETGYWTYGLGTYLHTYRSHQALHHAGGLPGQYTYQLTLPEKGMAVLVFSNNDTYSAGINMIVAYGVMDALLRLDVQDGNWEKRVMDTWLAAPQIHIKTIQENDKDPIYDKSPEEAGDQEPDPDPKMAIIGTYEHPAYPPIAISPLSTSSPLRPYLQSIQDCCSMPLSLDRREICIAHPKSVFVDAILFTHHSGPFWEWVATKLYKVSGLGDKSDQCELVAPFVDGQGRCVVGKSGLGMGGDWWVSGGKQTREVSEGRTKGVEVWYTRTKA